MEIRPELAEQQSVEDEFQRFALRGGPRIVQRESTNPSWGAMQLILDSPRIIRATVVVHVTTK